MITWHTIPCPGGQRSIAYCRIGSTLLRRTTCDDEPTRWQRALVHADGDGLPEWLARIEEEEWATIDRDEAGRLLGVVTTDSLSVEQLQDMFAAHCECRPLDVWRDETDHAAIHDCDTEILTDIQRSLFDDDDEANARCVALYNARLGWL